MESGSGVTRQRQSYFDDSSRAVGLSHRSKPPSSEIFDRGGDRLPKPGPLRDREIAERETILAGEKDVRDREIGKLIAQGCTPPQAAEIFDRERASLEKVKANKADEHDERRRKGVEQLMDVRKKPAKHSGSKSGRRRSGKRGTWICGSCKMEWCEHRPKSRGGRPATLGRSLEEHIRVSPLTRKTIRDCGIGTSDAIEVFAIAWSEGVSLRAAVAAFRSRKGEAAENAA